MEISGFTCGLIGYAAIAIFDINMTSRNNDRLETTYAVGAGFILLGILQDIAGKSSDLPLVARIVLGVLALVMLGLLFYTLFTYGNRTKWRKEDREDASTPWYQRKPNEKGIYALCRHPAVWFNVVFYFALVAAVGYPYFSAVTFSIFGLALAIIEDKAVFPKVVPGYDRYKKTTPFLFPNRSSAARCRETWNQR